jgi:DNA-binding XRE family transcriptional regulator
MSKEQRRQQLDEALGFDLTKRRLYELKLTQEQLAERLAVSRRCVSGWESGEYSPSLPQLVALRRALAS